MFATGTSLLKTALASGTMGELLALYAPWGASGPSYAALRTLTNLNGDCSRYALDPAQKLVCRFYEKQYPELEEVKTCGAGRDSGFVQRSEGCMGAEEGRVVGLEGRHGEAVRGL
jgi:hypothetical protein